MRPIVRHAAQIFPVMETRQITVVTANQFAFAGCDPYSYIVGNAVGLEQSGIIRPSTVVDCKYDSANSRMLVTFTGRVDTAKSLQVWKQEGSDAYYMMNGGPMGVGMYLPGGMGNGASPSDSALNDLGFFNPQARVLRNVGGVSYSNDYSYLGGCSIKINTNQVIAQAPNSGSASSGQIPYRNGMFWRMAMYIPSALSGNFYIYYRNYNGSYDQGFVLLNSNRTITVNEYAAGGGGTIFGSTTAWSVPIATWFDLAWEADVTGIKYRFWLNGAPQATLSGSGFSWYGGAFSCGNLGSFDNNTSALAAGAGCGVPIYFHDILTLNYAPVRADGVTLPVPAKPFSYPGLRAPY